MVAGKRTKIQPGFTLFEIIVAMFIMVVGVLGVTSVFSVGMHVRMRAQELVITQDLANTWAEWVRYRLSAEGLNEPLTLAGLSGATGDFYEDPGGSLATTQSVGNLPTAGLNSYQGYVWTVEKVEDYVPEFADEVDGTTHPWNKRIDGNDIFPGSFTTPLGNLKRVHLSITRGVRIYNFYYTFSGVGLKYDEYKPY